MSCPNKITQSIINNCSPKKGTEPIMYWDYLKNLVFTFSDNTITNIVAAPLGRIEVKKYGINAGHEAVLSDTQNARYKHKIDTAFNEITDVVDDMDAIVCFVRHIGETDFSVYGAKFGLYKTSQSGTTNDNLGAIAVAFESREGMEEQYERYTTSIDISALPNMEDFNLIYGGTIATGGAVKLTIDSDKTGYIRLPNGTILTTSAGVINTTYTGYGGNITYYVPKVLTEIIIDGVPIHGDLRTNVYDLYLAGSAEVAGIICTENTAKIKTYGNINQTILIAPKAVFVGATNCSLTAKSIGDILYAAYVDNRPNVNFDFSGGNNALQGAVNTYLQATYSGLTYATVYALLVTNNGGTILIDTV